MTGDGKRQRNSLCILAAWHRPNNADTLSLPANENLFQTGKRLSKMYQKHDMLPMIYVQKVYVTLKVKEASERQLKINSKMKK